MLPSGMAFPGGGDSDDGLEMPGSVCKSLPYGYLFDERIQLRANEHTVDNAPDQKDIPLEFLGMTDFQAQYNDSMSFPGDPTSPLSSFDFLYQQTPAPANESNTVPSQRDGESSPSAQAIAEQQAGLQGGVRNRQGLDEMPAQASSSPDHRGGHASSGTGQDSPANLVDGRDAQAVAGGVTNGDVSSGSETKTPSVHGASADASTSDIQGAPVQSGMHSGSNQMAPQPTQDGRKSKPKHKCTAPGCGKVFTESKYTEGTLCNEHSGKKSHIPRRARHQLTNQTNLPTPQQASANPTGLAENSSQADIQGSNTNAAATQHHFAAVVA